MPKFTFPSTSSVTSSDNTTVNGIVLLWDIFYLQDLDFEAVQKVTGEIVPFTLSPADANNSRIDVFVQNDAGNIEVREGVPAVNEVKPEVDTSTEIEVTFVIIEANATSPQSVSRTLVYDENVGAPAEFEAQGAIAQGVNVAHVADADTGVTSILFKDYDNKASVDFTADAATDIANFSHFEFSVKFDIPGTSVIELLLTDGTINSAPVFIKNGDYGLDFSNTQDFQKVRVPAQDFQYGSLVVLKISIRLYLNSDTATPAVLLDNISFVTGITAIVLNSFFNLDDTPPSAEGLEGKYLQVINGRIVAVAIEMPEAIVQEAFGNPFTLIKTAANNDPLNINTLQINDYGQHVQPDNVTLWPYAVYNGGDKNNTASWTPLLPIEEIPKN